MKTVRFSQIVEKSGKPDAYILWTDPKKDTEFQRALKQNRVMTVHQETVGAKADYGTVGFDKKKTGELLLFPKSLKRFEGKKVVGVKYDLLEKPAAAPKQQPKAKRKPKKAKTTKAERRNEKIIAFKPAQDRAPVKKTASQPPSGSLGQIRSELRRAIKTLEAGKAVKANQMLQELQRSLP
jgi:hypothetical protein